MSLVRGHFSTAGSLSMGSLRSALKTRRIKLSQRREERDVRYYAAYSSGFVDAVLDAWDPAPELVLDPWGGSATTGLVCSRRGVNSLLLDINPAAHLLAASRLAQFPSVSEIATLTQRTLKAIENAFGDADALVEAPRFLDQESARLISRAVWAIREAHGGRAKTWPMSARHRISAYFVTSFLDAVRLMWGTRPRNPTWLPQARPLRARRVLELFHGVAMDRAYLHVGRSFAGRCDLQIGDSRRIQLPDEAVSLVIGSPPYCTRLDYAMSTALELWLLGIAESGVARIRTSLMGGVCIRPDEAVRPLSSKVNELLAMVEACESHGAKYYASVLRQYFNDAQRSVSEIARVLRSSGCAVLVLQTSFFRGMEIDLPTLYLGMGIQVGLEGRVLDETPVSAHFVRIRGVKARQHREAVIVFRKP
jgi:hypothetical protein